MVNNLVKKSKSIFLIGLITFVMLELSLFIISHSGVLNIILPIYKMNDSEDFLPERSLLYGHRHLPNSDYEIKKNCLHTYYHFNNLGFRDADHTQKSDQKRIIVLGDSFMEGVAVDETERLSDLLEKETGIPHLNFAMADKGSTQAYIIYESIASSYEHDGILLSVFPVNDLIDDDPNWGKTENSIRPCWEGTFPNYELKFFPPNAPIKKQTSKWKQFLKSYTYTYDALFYLKESLRTGIGNRKNYPQTSYYAYSEEQLNRIKYSLLKLKEKAENKPITLICIPSHLDFQLTDKKQESIEKPLSAFCELIGIEFIGMMELFKEKSAAPQQAFYYACDSHWNANGHATAKEIVKNKSQLYQ